MDAIIVILFIAGITAGGVHCYKKAEERKKAIELQNQKIEFVKSHSQCLYAIKNLNRNYNFKEFDSHPRYKKYCNSKVQFDNFDIDNHILLTIEDSPDYFINLVKVIKYNRQKYAQYDCQFNATLNNIRNHCDYDSITVNSIIESNEFQSIEAAACNKLKKTAITDFLIELTVCYCSPRGRNHYQRTYKFTCADIEAYLQDYNRMKKNKASALYQRQLVTTKLRYEILRRDGFKCVICGRSSRDGAKLHVDHIKPVSKGGLTEESNLRTLCDMCNLGKSDSYNPHGLN